MSWRKEFVIWFRIVKKYVIPGEEETCQGIGWRNGDEMATGFCVL